jgi:adenylylsulfate kinase-like enzyme
MDVARLNHWPPFLLQIAGGSGAGKSTLACLIGERTGAMVIDLDAIKSAALDEGSPWDLAGRIGYGVSRAVAGSLLGQRKSVILDSPCRFQQIVDRGSAIAEQHGVPYTFIECVVADEEERRRRLLRDCRVKCRIWTCRRRMHRQTPIVPRWSPLVRRCSKRSSRRRRGCAST